MLCALLDLVEASEHHQFGLIMPFEIPMHLLCAPHPTPPRGADERAPRLRRSYLGGAVLYALAAATYLPRGWLPTWADEPKAMASRLFAAGSIAVAYACVLNGAHMGGAYAISDAAAGPRPPQSRVLFTAAATLTGAAALLAAGAAELASAGSADCLGADAPAAWLRAAAGACFAAAGAAPIVGAGCDSGGRTARPAEPATPATPADADAMTTPRKPRSRRYPSMD